MNKKVCFISLSPYAPTGQGRVCGLVRAARSELFQHPVSPSFGRVSNRRPIFCAVLVCCIAVKRWLMGTDQGAMSQEHLGYHLEEFTFRFNRRTSRHWWKLFWRLIDALKRHKIGCHGFRCDRGSLSYTNLAGWIAG